MIDRKKITLFVVITIILAIIAIIASLIKYQDNQFGDSLEIQNITDYNKGKPQNKTALDSVEFQLFHTVNLNIDPDITDRSVDDFFVRENTYSQVYNPDSQIHTVRFIVDSDSLGHSYRVQYEWMDDGEYSTELDEYGNRVTCLTNSDVVRYDDFQCIDEFTYIPEDPILKLLPHSEDGYKLTYNPDKEKTLNATIYTSAADERYDYLEAVEDYKSNIKQWIKDKKLNPDDYTIEYEIVRASIY